MAVDETVAALISKCGDVGLNSARANHAFAAAIDTMMHR